MATLLYTIIGMTASASLNCAVRREISPCTCSPGLFANNIDVKCEQMESFGQVVNALQDRFTPDYNIWLTISHSQLLDLAAQSFFEMNMNIKTLKMNFDNLRQLPVSTFQNLPRLEYFSAADNLLEEIPPDMFQHMPNVGTLDFARGRIKYIASDTFHHLQNLRHLVMNVNQLHRIDTDALSKTIISLQLATNNLATLNGTIRHLDELKWLFVNENNLTTLDDELPVASPNLAFILAQHNRIDHLPADIRYLRNLESLYIYGNRLRSLDGVLSRATHLTKLIAHDNKIATLRKDEFLETERLEELNLAGNQLVKLNGSLLNMKGLINANFSNNRLKQFSLQEVTGLRKLRTLDLSYNRIELLGGRMENLVDSGLIIYDLRLNNNLLKSLDGALMGLNNLRVLNVAHNQLETITPNDLIGMEELERLDLSFNLLKTLEELSKTFLPSLQTLNASYNQLTTMHKDFHGLPILCVADLSKNMIRELSVDLVSNTRCSNHGVPNRLEIFLDENPVLCNETLSELINQMEFYHTRLNGVAHCIVPQQMPVDAPIFIQPPIAMLQPLLNPQTPLGPTNVMIQPPSIVQILVPSTLVMQPPAAGLLPSVQGIPSAQQLVAPVLPIIPTLLSTPAPIPVHLPPSTTPTTATTTTIATTTTAAPTEAPTVMPTTLTAPMVVVAAAAAAAVAPSPVLVPSIPPTLPLIPQQLPYEKLKYDAQPETSAEAKTHAPPDENDVGKLLPSGSTTMQTILEFKNIIHDTYAALPPEVLPLAHDQSQGLATVPEEEPPETQQDQNTEMID